MFRLTARLFSFTVAFTAILAPPSEPLRWSVERQAGADDARRTADGQADARPAVVHATEAGPAADQTLWTSRGDARERSFVAIDAQGDWVFQSPTGRETVSAREAIVWGRRRDTGHRPVVILADGGRLALHEWQISATELAIPESVGSFWHAVSIARRQVRGLILQPPARERDRDRLERRVAENREPRDSLLLENQDLLVGALASTPMDESPTTLRLRTETGELEVATDRIQAVLFGAAAEPPSRRGATVLCGFRDGSALYGQRLRKEGDAVRLTLAGGLELAADAATFAEELVHLQSFGSHLVWLSDVEPLSYKHIAFLRRDWPLTRDASVGGGRLRHDGRLFTKGIGMHSTSRVAYDLDGKYQRLTARLAIDELAGRRGSVVFRVFVDRGEGRWQPAYESPVVRGGDPASPMAIDLTDALRMALIVDFADRGDESDHAVWLDAALTPIGEIPGGRK